MALGIDEVIQITLDGLRFNANEDTDPDGCYWTTALIGWNARRNRNQRTAKPTLPGSYRVPPPANEKVISLRGTCIAPTALARARAENRLAALCPVPELLYRMEVTEESGTVFRNVELEMSEPSRMNEYAFGFTIQVAAPDPFKYSTTTRTASTSMPVSGGGLDWTDPTGLDWTDTVGLLWGSPTSTGSLAMTNGGTAPAWPTFTLTAGPTDPLVNPSITELSTGRTLQYIGTLNVGDSLVIVTNPFGRSVTLNGAADRRPNLTRAEWFSIPAGGSTSASFSASVYTTGANLLAQWADTSF